MAPLTVLTDSITNLWYYVYGLIAGWGIILTLMLSGIIFLMARQLRTERRLRNLENQMVATQRDYNLTLDKWLKK
jgi:hypothetical protein